MRALFVARYLIPIYLIITMLLMVAVMTEALLAPPVSTRTQMKFRKRLLVVATWPALIFSSRGRRLMSQALRGL